MRSIEQNQALKVCKRFIDRPKKKTKGQGLAVVRPILREENEDSDDVIKFEEENDVIIDAEDEKENKNEHSLESQESSLHEISREEPFLVWQKNSQSEMLLYSKHRKREEKPNKQLSTSDVSKSPRKLRNSLASLINADDSCSPKVRVVTMGKKLGNIEKGYTTLGPENDEEESGDEDEGEIYGHISTTWVTSFWTQFCVLLQRNFKQEKPEILSKLNLIQVKFLFLQFSPSVIYRIILFNYSKCLKVSMDIKIFIISIIIIIIIPTIITTITTTTITTIITITSIITITIYHHQQQHHHYHHHHCYHNHHH